MEKKTASGRPWLLKEFSQFLKMEKRTFNNNKVLECGGDTRALVSYRLVDNLEGKEKSPILPKRSTPQDVAAYLVLISHKSVEDTLIPGCIGCRIPTSLLKKLGCWPIQSHVSWTFRLRLVTSLLISSTPWSRRLSKSLRWIPRILWIIALLPVCLSSPNSLSE